MTSIEFAMIDELINARRNLHGGGQGAPVKLSDNDRQGAALNRSIVLMLSATLQGYVETVFLKRAKSKFRLRGDDYTAFCKLHKRWGNPSVENINKQFGQIGIIDPLAGLSWQRCSNQTVRAKLTLLNALRNQLAHGAKKIKIDEQPYSLTLQKAINLRNFVEAFSERFERHVKPRRA